MNKEILKKGCMCDWCHEKKIGFALSYYPIDNGFDGWYCSSCGWLAGLANEAFENDDS